ARTVSAATVSTATTSFARNRSTAALAPAEKPAKVSGVDFKSWQQKCSSISLRGLSNDLYNVYNNVKTSKELWDPLEKKYKIEEAGMKNVVTQVQELQVIIHDLLVEGLIVNDVFQVAAIIEKLPPWWKDFKNYLKHKRKEITVEDLIVRLRIEEDNKAEKKRSRGNLAIFGANIVEEDPTKLKKRKKAFGPKSKYPKKKLNGSCFNCRKPGHRATEYRGPKKDKKMKDQENLAEFKGEMDDLCAMLSECNLIGNQRE
ncbi:hypothetical protein EJD97_023132, partial [Solanum chilense]